MASTSDHTDGNKVAEQDRSELALAVKRNSDRLAGLVPTTAPVRTPDERYLRVDLVSLSLVTRVEELRGDTANLMSMVWMLSGALLGVIASLIVDGAPVSGWTVATWVLLSCLAVFLGVFGYLSRKVSKKMKLAERRLLDQQWVDGNEGD